MDVATRASHPFMEARSTDDNTSIPESRRSRLSALRRHRARASGTFTVQRHGHRLSGRCARRRHRDRDQLETNVESKATTTGAGVYVIPYLANGLYRIRVEAAGFRPAQADEVTLCAAQTLTLDFKLDVETITEAMTVTAPVLETGTAEIGHYVSNKEFQTWPIAVGDGQRQIQQFIFSSLPGTMGGRSRGRSTAAATTRTKS